jgi:hypothetical protein
VYTNEDLSDIPSVPEQGVNISLDQCALTRDRVKKQLDSLNVSKAAGPDNIHARILYEMRDYLVEPLLYLTKV